MNINAKEELLEVLDQNAKWIDDILAAEIKVVGYVWEAMGNRIREYDTYNEFLVYRLCKHAADKGTRQELIDALADVDYDPGYGTQELMGVVYGDGFVVLRHEYDGSERWQYVSYKIPTDLR